MHADHHLRVEHEGSESEDAEDAESQQHFDEGEAGGTMGEAHVGELVEVSPRGSRNRVPCPDCYGRRLQKQSGTEEEQFWNRLEQGGMLRHPAV
jgi:hypothetical protein